MLYKQLEYFLAIVNTGSFSEAAEQCHISQSAISQQIKSLETELGTRLFDRHNRTFSLTKAGELLYRKGTVVKNDTDNLLKEIKSSNRDKDFSLRIGYVKCYGGEEFRNASAIFSSKYPDIPLSVISGNHEELYEALKDDRVDIILNDQRRAFSDDYVNFELADSHCYIEIANTHPFSKLDIIDVNDLKNTTCILVSSYSQRQTESSFYKDIIGLKSDFLFAENLLDARIMVASGQGFLPVEGIKNDLYYDSSISRIPLYKKGNPVLRKYCAFWKKDNSGYYIEEFADILKEQFL